MSSSELSHDSRERKTHRAHFSGEILPIDSGHIGIVANITGQSCAADGLPDGQVARGRPRTASTDAASHTVGR